MLIEEQKLDAVISLGALVPRAAAPGHPILERKMRQLDGLPASVSVWAQQS
jgi:hypothetical protein